MGEARWVLDVPAVALVRGSRVDENEAVLVGVGGKLGTAVPLRRCSAAGMELSFLSATADGWGETVLTATMTAGFVASLSGT